jgi:4-hydroxy-3-polyprenylbenzoate decarboxylase
MPYDDLTEFIYAMRRQEELLEIRQPASIDLEIACAADRVARLPEGGPALLFHDPVDADGKPYGVPVLINALGSERRISMVSGVDGFEGLRERLSGLLETLQTPRKTLIDKLQVLPTLKELSGFFPKYARTGPCHEVIQTGDDVDLDTIPILKTWPEDGGRFVTLPLVFTESPKDGKRNCGMYRIQQYDKRTTGFHVHTHHTAAEHMREIKAKGENKLPAAVCIGGAPAITFSAVIPLPPGLDEMIIAGFLQGKPVKMVPCKTVPLHVPASCDYVIEGWIHIDDMRTEGPFGDHTGFYSLADDYPTFHVSAITRRREPTYMATVVGPPPQEDAWMTRAIERLFLPLMQQTIPEVVDYRLPFSGVAHNLMLVKIHKSYPGQARKVAHAVWGLGQAAFTKAIVVIDQHGPDVKDEAAVARHVLDRLGPEQFEFVLGPTETLDHATRALHFGSKVAIDATTPFPGDPGTGTQGTGITGLSDHKPESKIKNQKSKIDLDGLNHGRTWSIDDRVFVIELDKTREHQGRELAAQIFERAGDEPLPLIILMQPGLIEPDSPAPLAWAALANIDPDRDILFNTSAEKVGHRMELRHKAGHVIIDATKKDKLDSFERDWPTLQKHPEATLNKVEALLKEAGLKKPMPRGL